jgi:hypothetical protein
MSSLLKSLAGDTKKIEKISEDNGEFPIKLHSYKDKVVTDYTRYNVDLNVGIAKIASADDLNDNQIARVIEEVNNSVYLLKYAQLRHSPEREVIFDLAALPTVKDIINNGEQKVASTEKKANQDSLNFLNYSSHEMGNLVPEKRKDIKEIVAEKLASESKALDIECKSSLDKVARSIYTVAEAFVKYDRSYMNAQDIFGTMCKEAQVTKGEQILYKKAIDQKVSQMKEAKLLPNDYALDLQLVDMNEKNEFSLGNYSMMKTASHSKKETPIVTDNGTVIKNVQDLITMANDIKDQRSHAINLDNKKKKLRAR